MNTAAVLEAFQPFRMPPSKIDQFDQGGREILADQLYPFVTEKKPIDFVMLGYPFKSTNHRDKTIGILPDLAEQISMENFRRFEQAITAVHPPGIRVHLVSDGFIFNDLLEETDNTVDAYAEVAKDMARGAPVELLSLRDFYPGESLPAAREKAMTQFGVTDVELEQRILMDPNVNALYRGMIRFMEEELAFKTFESKRQLHLAAKKLARHMMFRNEAFSQLAGSQFSSSIRLSMHPSTNYGKYSFQLIPGPKAWTSPWHCAVLVERDGSIATIHRKDAEAAGHELVHRDGRPFFFQEVTS